MFTVEELTAWKTNFANRVRILAENNSVLFPLMSLEVARIPFYLHSVQFLNILTEIFCPLHTTMIAEEWNCTRKQFYQPTYWTFSSIIKSLLSLLPTLTG